MEKESEKVRRGEIKKEEKKRKSKEKQRKKRRRKNMSEATKVTKKIK